MLKCWERYWKSKEAILQSQNGPKNHSNPLKQTHTHQNGTWTLKTWTCPKSWQLIHHPCWLQASKTCSLFPSVCVWFRSTQQKSEPPLGSSKVSKGKKLKSSITKGRKSCRKNVANSISLAEAAQNSLRNSTEMSKVLYWERTGLFLLLCTKLEMSMPNGNKSRAPL